MSTSPAPLVNLVAILSLAAPIAVGQTITVDTSDDVVDFGGARQVVDLPGPDGKISLAEAGLASDNTPGVQTIAFHVPQSDWQFQWLYPGRVVLRPFLGFRVFDTVIIDATTQTDFTGDTNPDGGEVVIWQESYLVDNVGSVMRGFDSSSINVSGGTGSVIQGNTQTNISIYDSPYCLIGGTGPGEGNTGGTIKIDRTSYNTVVGNTVQRVRILGWVDGNQTAVGNRVGGPTPEERNYITGYGTWTGEGYPGGTTVQIFDSVGTIIEGNWIGTTPDGMEQGSLASTTGVGFEGANHEAVIRNNRIAGILGHGTGPHYEGLLVGSAITLYGTGSGFAIQGNTIGLDALGEPVLGSVTGIATANYYLGVVQDVTIGGTRPGEGNEIAGQLGDGITVLPQFTGLRISGNSIHDNGGLGIDLLGPAYERGVSINDPLDADGGGNAQQNYPVLALAVSAGSTLHVSGTLDSSANGSFTVEFFASPACDPTGHGEGNVFLGSTSVTTDDTGHGSFNDVLSVGAPVGWFVTGTATLEPVGSTSEFSECLTITEGTSVGDLNCDGAVDGADIDPFFLALGDPAAYAQQFPRCDALFGDMNSDGALDGADIDPFFACLGGDCP